MRARALLFGLVISVTPAVAAAQVQIRPERAPERIATGTNWYKAGEPIMYRGDLFYPAGAQVFFDPSVMVMAGEFRGVPFYIDKTIEPGSIVYIPVGSGLVQPYEKPRAGDLAATSGSRQPSLPTTTATSLEVPPEVIGTAGTQPPPPAIGERTSVAPLPRGSARPAPRRPRGQIDTIAPNRTARNSGIWIEWNGARWSASGTAVRVGSQLVPIGTYDGRPVYRGPGGDRTIWIETAQGLAVPWTRR